MNFMHLEAVVGLCQGEEWYFDISINIDYYFNSWAGVWVEMRARIKIEVVLKSK